jgi:hypothetical protein
MPATTKKKTKAGIRWLSFKHLSKGRRRVAYLLLAILMLMVIATPLAMTAASAYQVYEHIRQLGDDGVHQLLSVKDIFEKSSSTTSPSNSSPASCSTTATPSASTTGTASASPTGSASPTTTPTAGPSLPGPLSGLTSGSLDLKAFTDKNKVNQAYTDFVAAKTDFVELQNELNSHPTLFGLVGMIPSYARQIKEANLIASAGIDIATLGAEVATTGLTILQKLPSNPLAAGNQPLFTSDEIPLIQTTINDVDQLLGQIQKELAGINLNDLPISTCQRQTFTKALSYLPEVSNLLDQVNSLLPIGIWALGIDKPRNFLVQTMDRAELRPSGGFTGQFGVVTINGGRIGSLSLQDVNNIDYEGNNYIIGNRPPAKWSWWPFPNWGLRDSNISADFPTTAQVAINLFAKEGGGQVDGVIALTPIPIEHILAITGPIYIPQYDETVTAQNLEDRLHYYEENPAGIAKGGGIANRKHFTSLVGQLLQERIRQEPVSQLILIAKQVLADMRSKDLEVYLSDPRTEALLTQYQLDGSIDHSNTTDTEMVVQANVSVNKASQYVQTTQKDVVQLDASGGATHHLTITLDYNKQSNNVYGFPTYRDYIRIYAPAGSRLISGYGFDSGSPMCLPSPPPGWKPPPPPADPKPSKYKDLPACSDYDPYPSGGLSCPYGRWAEGEPYSFDYMDKSDEMTPWPLDYLSGPRNTSSDEPGLAMWGGLVLVPPNCTAYITLTWYTPNVAAPGKHVGANQAPYSLLVQRQSGTFNTIQITIKPASGAANVQGTEQVTFNGTLSANQLISLEPLSCKNGQNCT